MATIEQIQPEYRELITRLADKRLVVTGRDEESGKETVEVVHEALIRHWQALRQWVDEEREFLVWQEKLRVLRGQWLDNEQDEGALLRGLPLNEALQWRVSHEEYLADEERDFIEASKQLRKREKKEKEEQRQKNIIVAAQLAHKIRNPITAIGGSARVLNRRNSDPQQLKFLEMMIREVVIIEQTLDDLFGFVDKAEIKKERVLVYPLIIKSLMPFYKTMQKQGIEYQVIVPDEQLMCELDSQQMKRAFVNLVRNAVEAMKNGGKLTIEVLIEPEQVCFFVRDNGIGIAVSDLKQVVEPFYTTKTNGTGVGLTWVKRIINDHNGNIVIRRINSGGTEVAVILPL